MIVLEPLPYPRATAPTAVQVPFSACLARLSCYDDYRTVWCADPSRLLSTPALSLPCPSPPLPSPSHALSAFFQVPFSACLERLVAPELLDDYHSAALGRRTKATKQTRVASFPPYLMLALRRYYVGEGWVPKKLDVLVEVRHGQGLINPK